jgi:hypothetical protein
MNEFIEFKKNEKEKEIRIRLEFQRVVFLVVYGYFLNRGKIFGDTIILINVTCITIIARCP